MAKKISHWSLVGYIIGTLFALFSSIRYFILFPDTDRALLYVGIVMIICGLSWRCNNQLEHSNTIDAMEEYLADKG